MLDMAGVSPDTEDARKNPAGPGLGTRAHCRAATMKDSWQQFHDERADARVFFQCILECQKRSYYSDNPRLARTTWAGSKSWRLRHPDARSGGAGGRDSGPSGECARVRPSRGQRLGHSRRSSTHRAVSVVAALGIAVFE